MAVRDFNASLHENIRVTAPAYFTGDHTLVWVLRRDTNSYHGIFSIGNGTHANPDLVIEFQDDGKIEYVWPQGSSSHLKESSHNWADTNWRLQACTFKAGNTDLTKVRFHSFDGVTWTHANAGTVLGGFGGSIADWTGTTNPEARFGHWDSNFNFFDGRMAVQALWRSTCLTDNQIEALAGLGYAGYAAAGANHLWEFSQSSINTSVNDLIGSCNQTGIDGTRVVLGDDPPSSLYALIQTLPSNTFPPVITGTPAAGQTLSCSSGTWDGYPTPTFTYQWYRNAGSGYAPISGATGATYIVRPADGSTQVKCVVTGTNTQGAATADSNAVFPPVPPPLAIEIRLSGGASNADAATSIGGAQSSALSPVGLFDDVPRSEANPGFTDYRLVYIHNNDTLSATTTAWISDQPGAMTLSLGAAVEGTGTAAAIANDHTAPAGVTFSTPVTAGTALTLGQLDPGQSRGLWIRRVIPPLTGSAVSNEWEISIGAVLL